jgi:hypothetical protein
MLNVVILSVVKLNVVAPMRADEDKTFKPGDNVIKLFLSAIYEFSY